MGSNRVVGVMDRSEAAGVGDVWRGIDYLDNAFPMIHIWYPAMTSSTQSEEPGKVDKRALINRGQVEDSDMVNGHLSPP